jgi:hypothetical protein
VVQGSALLEIRDCEELREDESWAPPSPPGGVRTAGAYSTRTFKLKWDVALSKRDRARSRFGGG